MRSFPGQPATGGLPYSRPRPLLTTCTIFESGEDHLADHSATKSCYLVKEDCYWLDNYLVDPYNDGYATIIYFLSGC